MRNELARCQTADYRRLSRELRELQKLDPASTKYSHKRERLRAALDKSAAACARRSAAIPDNILYPPELPVSARAQEIATLLRQHQVLVLAGDTGSGKTTQLPKICLQAGLGRRGLIGHTQPRRLAAVSVANRIAEELGSETGRGVGYQVRFNDKQSDETFLKVMTDGILLTEIAHDRFLNKYEAIIIDEA
ncbi:MAG: ATP-dependent RNA helicase HrpA, partial [Pseudohongiellaceae bacterium]